jgi:uncharacterized membrane protein YeaQ/YmgE (transglycosylase-associated protein family)
MSRKLRLGVARKRSRHITGVLMSILAWIILGLVAGFIASKIVNRHGEGIILDVLLGIVGSVVGGWLFHSFGRSGVTGLNLESLLVATIGAAVVLVVYHMMFRSSRFRRI